MAAERRLYLWHGLIAHVLNLQRMHISNQQLKELTEIIEDTIEYFCDKEKMSGQLAWTCIECLSTAKLAELNGELTASV